MLENAKGSTEQELLRHVTKDWRAFKDILWEFNGPRERTIEQCNLQRALDGLCRKKILERQAGKKRVREGQAGFGKIENGDVLYRRRPANV